MMYKIEWTEKVLYREYRQFKTYEEAESYAKYHDFWDKSVSEAILIDGETLSATVEEAEGYTHI